MDLAGDGGAVHPRIALPEDVEMSGALLREDLEEVAEEAVEVSAQASLGFGKCVLAGVGEAGCGACDVM